MSDTANELYEGLFLMNNASIGSDLSKGLAFVREILDRAGAQVEAVAKWDERRLAYEIKGQKRGLYLLAYFRVSGGQIPNIERDVSLSEQALRCLILRAEHIGEAELELARQKDSESRDAAAVAAGSADADEAPKPAAPKPAATAVAEEPVDASNDSADDDTNTTTD